MGQWLWPPPLQPQRASLPWWKIVRGVHGSPGGFLLPLPTPGLLRHLQCLAEPVNWPLWPAEAPVLGSCFSLEVPAHRFQVSFL